MEACTEDTLFAIAEYLPPHDLASLALTCQRFGGKGASASTKKRRPGTWPWSILEEASRRRVSAAKNDTNNPWRNNELITIRGEESWMAVDHRLHLLQNELVFSRIIGNAISYVDGDIRHVQVKRGESAAGLQNHHSVAICQEVMKSGKHRAPFTAVEDGDIAFGIIRPIHDWPKKKIRIRDFQFFCRVRKERGDPAYAGTIHQRYYCYRLMKDDVIGLLLDLDNGILNVFKNGECVVEVREIRWEIFAGHYCWAVTPMSSNTSSVRIRKAPPPM